MSSQPQFPPWTTPYRAGPGPVPAWVARRKILPPPFRARELVGLALVALAVDVALWNGDWFGSGGIGAAIILAAVPLGALAVARRTRRSPRLFVLGGLIALCAVRCVLAPNAGAILTGVALTFAFVLALRMKRTWVPEVMASMFSTVERMPSRVGAALRGVRGVVARTRMGRFSLLPVLVPAGIAAAFLGVFALANPLVERGVVTAWTSFERLVGFPHPARIVLWLATVIASAALFRPACHRALAKEAEATTGEASTTNVAVARNTLVLLNLMFAGYNALDAACLWAGAPPAGTTTQIYAHQGAAWLTVALAMLTAVVGYLFRGPLAHDPSAKLARVLAYVWMGQGALLAAGTYRRIAMHVAWSGLSDLRIVGILGTTLVVLGMVTVLVKLARTRSFGWLVRRQLDLLVGAFVLYALFPTHLVSAEVNVARIEHGEFRPALHLLRQGGETESAAALIPLLEHPDARIRQGAAALLLDKKDELQRSIDAETSFRQRDLASRRTLRALTDAEPELGRALGGARRGDARNVLYQVVVAANDGASLEQLLSIPDASYRGEGEGGPNTR